MQVSHNKVKLVRIAFLSDHNVFPFDLSIILLEPSMAKEINPRISLRTGDTYPRLLHFFSGSLECVIKIKGN